MILIKNISVGLYGIAIKEKEVLADEGKFNEFFHSAKAYIDKHTYVGYVIVGFLALILILHFMRLRKV